MTPAQIKRALETHGRRRTKAREAAIAETAAIAALLADALAAGHSKADIARWAQMSRPAIDTLLKEQGHG
jgi:hypothetical protein